MELESSTQVVVNNTWTGGPSVHDWVWPTGTTVDSDGAPPGEDEREAYIFSIARAISYLLPAIVLLGLIGNSLSFAVMVQPHNRRLSSGVYMAVLAVSDTVVLLSAGHYWIRTVGWFGEMAAWECPCMVYLGQHCVSLGVFIIVAMTVERCLAVRFPLKSVRWFSTKKSKITIAILATILFGWGIPYLMYARATHNGFFIDCLPYSVESEFAYWHSSINVFMNSLIPFAILLFLNVIIIKAIRNRKNFFEKDKTQDGATNTHNSPQQNDHSTADRVREQQMTVQLVLVSFALLILTAMQYLRYALGPIQRANLTPADNSLISTISNRLFFTSNACNFLLYCIGGSKFRQDLIQLFSCTKKIHLRHSNTFTSHVYSQSSEMTGPTANKY